MWADRLGLCPWCSPVISIGARPTPIVTPRTSPIAQGVRQAIRQAEKANPGSRYNRNQMDRIMQDNGLPPRLRPEQMTETIDSCPVPPRLNPGGSRPDSMKFWNNLLQGIKDLADSGVVNQSPIPAAPSNVLWPTQGRSGSNNHRGTRSAEEFEQICRDKTMVCT